MGAAMDVHQAISLAVTGVLVKRVSATRTHSAATTHGTKSAWTNAQRIAEGVTEKVVRREGQGPMAVNLSLEQDVMDVPVKTASALLIPSAAIPSGMKHAPRNAQMIAMDVTMEAQRADPVEATRMDVLPVTDPDAAAVVAKRVYAKRTPTAAIHNGTIFASAFAPTTAVSVEMEVARALPMGALLQRAQDAEDANARVVSAALIASAATTRGMMFVFSNVSKTAVPIVPGTVQKAAEVQDASLRTSRDVADVNVKTVSVPWIPIVVSTPGTMCAWTSAQRTAVDVETQEKEATRQMDVLSQTPRVVMDAPAKTAYATKMPFAV